MTNHPFDATGIIAVVRLRMPIQWRWRRGRAQRESSATIARQINVFLEEHITKQWPSAFILEGHTRGLPQPTIVQEGIPTVYLVGRANFWAMAQKNDFLTELNPNQAVLSVLVSHRTLADPIECTIVLADRPWIGNPTELPQFDHLLSAPAYRIAFDSFWRPIAERWGMIRVGAF